MRVRFFTAVTAVALAIAVVAAFGTVAGARTGVSPKAATHTSHKAKVFAKPSALVSLWNQNNQDSGGADSSQNFEAANDAFDDQAAADVKVKAGTTWKVKEVDVTGQYSVAGPAVSENVTFYKDAGGKPGAVKKAYTGLVGADSGGSFVITLPTVTKLTAGTYWVSVQVNMDFDPSGQWYWETRTVKKGKDAVWQNPGDGFGTGCTTWTDIVTCIPTSAPDLMFQLKGTKT
jgi:hypothetical protein